MNDMASHASRHFVEAKAKWYEAVGWLVMTLVMGRRWVRREVEKTIHTH
jgi:hypothetical protein